MFERHTCNITSELEQNLILQQQLSAAENLLGILDTRQ